MRTSGLSFLAAAAVLASAPAAAQGRSATIPVRHGYHSDPLANALGARLASINARIAMLRDRGALGSEEAEELRKQSRRLELRLYGLSRREAGDVELGIDRLESAVRFAADDARWGGHSFNRDLNERYEHRARDDQNRYEARRDKDYENFDRYTGSSVDRWHDPFDRGN